MSKDTVKHSYENAPTQSRLKELIDDSTGKDRLILILTGKYTMRAGEASHMRSWWLHIGDEVAKEAGVDHIQIPRHGDLCTCDTCMIYEFRKMKKDELKKSKYDKKKIKKPAGWWDKMQKKYYELKRKGKLPKLPEHKWSPKSSAGARLIPLSFSEYTKFIQDYFEKHDSICLTRQAIWQRMRKFGIHPHQNRATAIMYWSKKKMHPRSLMKIAGHEHVGATDPYDVREVWEMIEETKEIVNRDKL